MNFLVLFFIWLPSVTRSNFDEFVIQTLPAFTSASALQSQAEWRIKSLDFLALFTAVVRILCNHTHERTIPFLFYHLGDLRDYH
jgi:hypothetical protein